MSDVIEDHLCLVTAIKKHNIEKVKEILNGNEAIDVNRQIINDRPPLITPMHWASGVKESGVALVPNLTILEPLLSHGGDPNIAASNGTTPVHIAAMWDHFDVLTTLVEHGGDPWILDDKFYSAWDWSLHYKHWNVLQYLNMYMAEGENRDDELAKDSFYSSKEKINVDLSTSKIVIPESLLMSDLSLNDRTIASVEKSIYFDAENGASFEEWTYPPPKKSDSINESLYLSFDEHENDSKLGESQLREQLKSLGVKDIGPITASTKELYLRKLYKLRMETNNAQIIPSTRPSPIRYSSELDELIKNFAENVNFKFAMNLDNLVVANFSCSDKAENKKPKKPFPLREGVSKQSFNYILLDPRKTKQMNLNESQDEQTLFQLFVSSIFYIGKGKKIRPLQHLYEAEKLRKKNNSSVPGFVIDKKTQQILDIWNDGRGVVCVEFFHHCIPIEAYCREAAMIEAIGLSSITNEKRGNYYGVCKTLPDAEKRWWGSHLIKKAFHIFMCQGEREIRPPDL